MKDFRDAVITIQGGGVFGLSLLGQLQAVLEGANAFAPMAYAGTSAGAIIATLVWAKFKPTQIKERIVAYAESEGLTNLLGPFDDLGKEKFDFGGATKIKEQVGDLWKRVTADQNLIGKGCTSYKAFSTIRALRPHFENKGLFRGDKLEAFIEDCLRDAPDIRGQNITRKGEPLKFKHFRELQSKNGASSYRPPLFITVTNLSAGTLEFVNSIEDRYQNLSVAKVVRASGGFPLFFRPTELTLESSSDYCVDGGVVSNFPAWVYLGILRQSIQQSKHFKWFSSKAWVHVGLRVVEDDPGIRPLNDARPFYSALAGMLTGGARNLLEERLEILVPRSIIINQPKAKTDGPGNVLEIASLNKEKITSMVSRGYEFASDVLGSLPKSIIRWSNGAQVEQEIEAMLRRCEVVFGAGARLKLRGNVFLAIGEEMVLTHKGRMTGDPDENFRFDLSGGLTGHCYMSRLPLVCNVEKIRALAEHGALRASDLFGMPLDSHMKVREDRTWLASVPIFDPYDVSHRAHKVPFEAPSGGPHSFRLNSSLDGGVLGVLNVDAAIDYKELGINEDPNDFTDPRIQGVLDIMQASATRIAILLAETFKSGQV